MPSMGRLCSLEAFYKARHMPPLLVAGSGVGCGNFNRSVPNSLKIVISCPVVLRSRTKFLAGQPRNVCRSRWLVGVLPAAEILVMHPQDPDEVGHARAVAARVGLDRMRVGGRSAT